MKIKVFKDRKDLTKMRETKEQRKRYLKNLVNGYYGDLSPVAKEFIDTTDLECLYNMLGKNPSIEEIEEVGAFIVLGV